MTFDDANLDAGLDVDLDANLDALLIFTPGIAAIRWLNMR